MLKTMSVVSCIPYHSISDEETIGVRPVAGKDKNPNSDRHPRYRTFRSACRERPYASVPTLTRRITRSIFCGLAPSA